MRTGIYERLVREGEEAEVRQLEAQDRAWVEAVPETVRRDVLLDDLAARIPGLLDLAASQSEDEAGPARHELRLIARMLRAAREGSESDGQIPFPSSELRLLRAIHEPRIRPVLPMTGLKRPWLFTSGKGEPTLYSELRAELETAERLDILVSFIKRAGVRKLEDVLDRVTAVDAQGNTRLQIRILTTTYMGATDRTAVERLALYPGVEVRISLDGRRERLHAKAWIFRRPNGFGSAFVGSANLSKSALIDGIEWTLKISQSRDPALFESATANFETLWNDPEFSPFNPKDPKHLEALDLALQEQRSSPLGGPIAVRTWFDLQPKPFQQAMLDRLSQERSQGRFRNLLVAATGTGKTVVSAFDYRRFCREKGGRPRLVFIAHQRQILEQARNTFRHVLRDPGFGELLDGSNDPASYDHLFAMIQTVGNRGLVEQMGCDFWGMAVIDEAHHLPAKTFSRVVQSLRPTILLGLTATPERLDGEPLTGFFDSRPDGSPACSLRIWDALDQQLLCPFEYYATADGIDLKGIEWGKAAELRQLSEVLTGNEIRARSIAVAVERYVDDIADMKALAFCASIEHARYMTTVFRKMGLKSITVSGEDSQSVREEAIEHLQSGMLQVVCSVNLFNEGIDIPAVNTLFLLRPTQSPVVFQQQIGRGLRLNEGKSCCLILDFVGVYNGNFRFDALYRGLTGLSRRQLLHSVENGFGTLPPGCYLQLDKVSRERVLSQLRDSARFNRRRLRGELLAWAAGRSKPLRLSEFLHEQVIEIDEIYEDGRSWQGLLREAGLAHASPTPNDENLLRRMELLLHANDPRLIRTWRRWLSNEEEPGRAPLMLAHQVLHESGRVVSSRSFRQLLLDNPAVYSELDELLCCLEDFCDNSGRLIPGAPPEWPLSIHARYGRREVLAAVGYTSEQKRPSQREGVATLDTDRICVLFVTLDKSEGFHDRVKYRDYAVSPHLFAWETQNRAHPGNRLGKRFIESPDNGWRFFLLVREDSDHGFAALGEVRLESWERCEKGPIPIVWRLVEPMPAELFRRFSVLRDV